MNPQLIENVLEKLGLNNKPEVSLKGLTSLYGQWCQNAPFDNLQKRLFFSCASTGELPGSSAEDYFSNWLKHGTGGTCWAVSNALYELLDGLGFSPSLVSATMLASSNARGPNHGTVFVTLENNVVMIDGSLLTQVPIEVEGTIDTKSAHPASNIKLEERDGGLQMFWRSLHRPDGIWCRIDKRGHSKDDFSEYHEHTRIWSPFNYSVYTRVNTKDGIKGIAFGEKVHIDSDSVETREQISFERICEFLINEMNYSEEIVSRLPQDQPMEPPPSSRRQG